MEHFTDRVAVVTGGASGIGLALGQTLANAGMRVALVDVEKDALADAPASFPREQRAGVSLHHADVSVAEEVDRVAEEVRNRHGAVHVLCNNAGVSVLGRIWSHTPDDWRWIVGVNVWGVINGIRSFVPAMIEHGEPSHVVNTASVAGLYSFPMTGAYCATKHAVVALSESLHHDLNHAGIQHIGVSLLCPTRVATRMTDAARNRPQVLSDSGDDLEYRRRIQQQREAGNSGMDPAQVARIVVDAIRNDTFYVFLDDAVFEPVRLRADNIRSGGPPGPRPQLPGI